MSHWNAPGPSCAACSSTAQVGPSVIYMYHVTPVPAHAFYCTPSQDYGLVWLKFSLGWQHSIAL